MGFIAVIYQEHKMRGIVLGLHVAENVQVPFQLHGTCCTTYS